MARNVLRILNLFRITYLNFTALAYIIGILSVSPALHSRNYMLEILVLFCFHFYIMWLNDIVDLEIDRKAKERSIGYLIEGMISRRKFSLLTLMMLPIMFLATYLNSAPLGAYLCLSGAVIGMSIYDLYGKKCKAFPLLTDASQGLGWAFFVLYAALMHSPALNALTYASAFFFFIYILMANGGHGGLRDLRNDIAGGGVTASVFFGCRENNNKVFISKSLWIFTYLCLSLLILISLYVLHLRLPGINLILFWLCAVIISMAYFSPTYIYFSLMRENFDVAREQGNLVAFTILLPFCVSFLMGASEAEILLLLVGLTISIPLSYLQYGLANRIYIEC